MKTRNTPVRTIALSALAIAAAPSFAQTNIDTLHKYSWQENCGWMNWRDANAGAQGVFVNTTFLAGFIWCENIGWVNVGDGTPGGGAAYTNASGSDAGVNILVGGDLSGLGWGENVGWIIFDTAAAVGVQRARFDSAAQRFRGYAWGENIGWINLDDATTYVALGCYANCDGSSVPPILTANDFQCFLNAFAANASYANCDGSSVLPVLTANDFQCFLNQFAAGCS